MVSFNNIIGHKDIVKHLQNAIKTEKISHSYIFTGRPGSGKKLIATTYAMTLQCEAGGTEPCQKCDSCKKALGKNHPDIIMVNHEKPGTISIDEIREQVIHDVAVKPYCSPHKIYIIPDAEMMTVQAQNALLKTIEEPPEYAVIILLTSNIDALLPTIQSRCVRLDLKVVDDSLVLLVVGNGVGAALLGAAVAAPAQALLHCRLAGGVLLHLAGRDQVSFGRKAEYRRLSGYFPVLVQRCSDV